MNGGDETMDENVTIGVGKLEIVRTGIPDVGVGDENFVFVFRQNGDSRKGV